MTNILFELRATPPYRDVKGRFTRAEEAQLSERANIVREEGRRFLSYARKEAPGERYPARLGVDYFTRGTHMGFELTGPQPLSTFIQKGTRPHIIRARRANALRFFWPKVGMLTLVPKSGGFRTHVRGDVLWIGKGYVNHPGTKPNKFIGRAFARWLPGARSKMKKVSDKFIRTFMTTGGSRGF